MLVCGSLFLLYMVCFAVNGLIVLNFIFLVCFLECGITLVGFGLFFIWGVSIKGVCVGVWCSCCVGLWCLLLVWEVFVLLV